MNILAIDTSTHACSVALDASGSIYDTHQLAPQQHTRLVLPMIAELLNQAGLERQQINAVAFTHGPGSFTGLRIATGVVQGLCLALDIPAIPISTLQVLAQTAYRELGQAKVLAMLDARMQEVYWGVYELMDNLLMMSVSSDSILPPQDVFMSNIGQLYAVGTGLSAYPHEFKAITERLKGHSELLPKAKDMLPLAHNLMAAGNIISASDCRPVYLRDKVVNS